MATAADYINKGTGDGFYLRVDSKRDRARMRMPKRLQMIAIQELRAARVTEPREDDEAPLPF